MHWPQVTVAFFLVLQVVVATCRHGETREWNGVVSFIDVCLMGGLLWAGGFFS